MGQHDLIHIFVNGIFFFSIKKAKLSPLHNCGGSSMISVSRKLYLANRETLSKGEKEHRVHVRTAC